MFVADESSEVECLEVCASMGLPCKGTGYQRAAVAKHSKHPSGEAC